MNNIFVPCNDLSNKDIGGKITMTNIMEIIPPGSIKEQIKDWKKIYTVEWRWRFLEFDADGDTRKIVEISRIRYNQDEKNRLYFNRYGQWVNRTIDPIYDKCVTSQLFFYTKN